MRENIVYVIIFIIICMVLPLTGCASSEVFVEGPVILPTINDKPVMTVTEKIELIDGGPVSGGTLTLVTEPIDSMNPFTTTNKYVNYISCFIYESLFTQLSDSSYKKYLVADFSNENFKVFSFTLNDGVKFHDGSELTSYDVRFTLREMEKYASSFYKTDIIENIVDFNIISSSKFEITLKEPDKEFIKKLTFPILSQTHEQEQDINGTGPYSFRSISDIELKLVKNDDWWYSNTYFDNVVFKICNEDEMLDAFQDNIVDIAFVKNVNFSKYQYRTDIDYRVFPSGEANYLYVNPNSIFGQANRQSTLFSYVANSLHDLNLGQVQYFEQYISSSIDIDGFRSELIESGFIYNEKNNEFTYNRKPLGVVSIAVPYQDIPKLHTANFIVNILGDAGITAEIVTINKKYFSSEIHSGKYDLSPISEDFKPWESLDDNLERIQQDFRYGRHNAFILPLYRNQQAVLFKNDIRGEKTSNYWNPYQGFHSWYRPGIEEGKVKK